MSWIWPEYINRDLPLTQQDRRAIHRLAWKLWWANKWNVVLYLILPAFYLATVTFARDAGGLIAATLGAGGVFQKLCRAGSLLVHLVMCFIVGGALLQRFRFAPCVYRAIQRHGYDVCLRCGYWLRGLLDETDRCPECGKKRGGMCRPVE